MAPKCVQICINYPNQSTQWRIACIQCHFGRLAQLHKWKKKKKQQQKQTIPQKHWRKVETVSAEEEENGFGAKCWPFFRGFGWSWKKQQKLLKQYMILFMIIAGSDG